MRVRFTLIGVAAAIVIAASAQGAAAQAAIDTSYVHTCAVLSDGTVQCWGLNNFGQLGDGTTTNRTTPVTVNGVTNAIAVSAGLYYSCAVISDGTARCWGQNDVGQLGNGTTTNSLVPVPVSGLTNAVAITTSPYHSCAVLSNGTAKCWGWNLHGQVGDGTNTLRTAPVNPVSGLTNVTSIGIGLYHVCASLADGTARCWGYGWLGGPVQVSSSTPVVVSGLTGVATIGVGWYHTCATLADGGARCWGPNNRGQLGNGTTTLSGTPVTVSGLTNAVQIAGGLEHSCATLADGSARCWGYNGFRQLGDGTGIQRLTPAAVVGLTNAVGVVAGAYHSCAALDYGVAKCWGANFIGMIGDGTSTDRATPVTVNLLGALLPPDPPDSTKPVISVSSGYVLGSWTNQNVTVTFACADENNGSGVDPASLGGGTSIVSSEGSGQLVASPAGFCKDNAGNTADTLTFGDGTTGGGINIDKTAPTIAGARTPAANPNGWNNSDVSAAFTCSDAFGIASCTGDTVLTAEAAGQSATGTATDLAGNTASATISGVNIDKSAPTIAGSRSPAANASGWNNTAVAVSFGCTDEGPSGLASCAGATTLAGDGTNQSVNGLATDLAGNTASALVGGISIDTTLPSALISTPASGATYTLNQSIAAAYTCGDGLSGIAACAGTVAAGAAIDTASVGIKSFSLASVDKAGNGASAIATYTVAYAFGGFQQPISEPVSRFKAGATIPVKFAVRAADGASVSTAVATISINGGGPLGTARYDAAAQQYIFNLSTKGLSPGPLTIGVSLDDGTMHTVVVTLR